MSGRKRRASTSSVETVDGDKIRWLQESSVVRSQPKDVPRDQYPCFELRDATVYDRKGEALENALNVVVRGPYIVRGHLIIDDPSQKAYPAVIMRVRASTPIEIRHCISYSIGEEPGARPVVWVLGRGAWYEISPSEAYRPIFNQMCEATTMYYNLVDIYNTGRLNGTRTPPSSNPLEALRDDFLQRSMLKPIYQYSMKVGDGATFNEVVERCAHHATFFASQFEQEPDGLINWKQTPFYKWFTDKHADVVHKTRVAFKNPRKAASPPREVASPAPSNRSSNRITRSASSEVVELDQFQLSKRPKPASNTDMADPDATARRPTMPPPSAGAATSIAANDDSPFASVLAAVECLYEKRVAAKRGVTWMNALNMLYFDYKFPNFKDGTVGSHRVPVEEVLHYNAAALLQVLDKERFQKHELYSYLENLSQKPFSPRSIKPSDFPYRLVPRKATQRQSKKSGASAVDSESSARKNSAANANGSPRHVGKTLKWPGRRPGKTSGLRTVATSKKRAYAEIGDESEPDSEASGLKRSHYFSDRDEEEEDVSMRDSTEANTPKDAGLVAQPQPAEAEPIQIVIRTEKIPSTVPRGPDDTWTCDQDGCAYVVRGGDADGCQARIQRHFEEHEQQNKRLSLAVTESTRGHMPIKYAYFPPFLILVEFPPPSNTANTAAPAVNPAAPITTASSSPSSQPAATHSLHPSAPASVEGFSSSSPSPPPNEIPDLSGSARESFCQLVDQFRRRPQPVSDKIGSLTMLQSFTREAQANGRKGAAEPAACHARWSPPAVDQEETDSMTLRLDDDDS
ncbi:hypothetical protein Trco_001187 [Trichoderma cornu-damae]|uniref:DNA (cytosine-5)-methyltransferase 1 replication foci domain-containing protein n=1 Tax=Trichoderma cornu-damae TaxID=654480 RepID=A0A9P8U0M2_9HYPO|nr:hypothetical protein Trco_001187 [Trichoderma cornu-damae]